MHLDDLELDESLVNEIPIMLKLAETMNTEARGEGLSEARTSPPFRLSEVRTQSPPFSLSEVRAQSPPFRLTGLMVVASSRGPPFGQNKLRVTVGSKS